jgi:hypothetical protein
VSENLERFARRVEGEPGFWAGVLAKHRLILGLTEDRQAALLHTDRAGLVRLALCRLPRPDHHAEDMHRVAEHVGADPDALAGILDACGN